jgi:serine/threonine protein phosphatase PrpC
MIYAYGITLDGTYHLKNNIVCQDAHAIEKCGNDMAIAAVADGLGSEEHSDVASRIAAEISTCHCKENIDKSSKADNILEAIKGSFAKAQKEIVKEAEAQGQSIDQYDTTLSLAVLINDTLYYGHSGDSGIVALTSEGLYEKVTEQQRDEENRVFPLIFEDKWVFSQYSKKVCSVFLATDGMYETLFPFLLKNEPVAVHVNLARYFMDNRSLCIDEEGENAVKARIENFIKNIPDEQVNDDKTVVVLVNSSVESNLQGDDYYKEPNWADLKLRRDKEWKRLAYPYLIKDDSNEETPGDDVKGESKQ